MNVIPLRASTPYSVRKVGGVIRAAALIAADDAADRLLSTTYMNCTLLPPQDDSEAGEYLARAMDIATELHDFSTLAGSSPADLLRNAARTYQGDGNRAHSIATALEIVSKVRSMGMAV